MKTVREWLKECLSEEDYKKAKQYETIWWKEKDSSFERAISTAFTWYETKEGHDYWSKIYYNGGSLNTDPIVESVCEDLRSRSAVGFKKYDITLKDADLSDKESLQHAYEEALDLVNHLKILITKQNGHNT